MSAEASGSGASGFENATIASEPEICPTFDTENKCLAVVVVRRIIAILSLLSCFFILYVLISLKKYLYHHQRLVIYLTCAVIVYTFHYCWGDYNIANRSRNGELNYVRFCKVQGWYHIFTAWMTFLWLCFITITVTIVTFAHKRPTKVFDRVYLPINVIVAAIFSIIPFTIDAYGPAGVWCWISSKKNGERFAPGIALQFSLFYGPWILLCIVMTVVLISDYVIIKKRLQKMKNQAHSGEKENQKKLWNSVIKPLIPFPLIFILTFIFAAANRLRLAFAPSSDPASTGHFILFFLHGITLPLPGIFFGIVIVIQYWKELKMKFQDTINKESKNINASTEMKAASKQ